MREREKRASCVFACVHVCVREGERDCASQRKHFLKMKLHRRGMRYSLGVATVSSIDKIIGLFCRISSLL